MLSPSAQANVVQAALAQGDGFRNNPRMMKPLQIFMRAAVCAMLVSPAHAQTVTVFAASSLKTALDQVIAEQTLDVVAVYGGSAAMARQIAQGAQADLVILAHQEWMDWLSEKDVLVAQSRCDLIGNALVLAGRSDATELALTDVDALMSALNGARLAVGNLKTVPAGQYTASYLRNRGWLDALKPHLAQTSNVRLALALISRGETPLGFVYASDVKAEDSVKRVFTPDPDQYPPIRYTMARLKGGATKGLDIAQSIAKAGQIFHQNGFSELPEHDASRCQ